MIGMFIGLFIVYSFNPNVFMIIIHRVILLLIDLLIKLVYLTANHRLVHDTLLITCDWEIRVQLSYAVVKVFI